MAHRILILGGTGDARRIATLLMARGDCLVTLSLAGRTAEPVAQGVPVISGGFGGPEGLSAYLQREQVALLVDATHPYAARMAANAAEAARRSGVPLVALRRPAWSAVVGDRWTAVRHVEDAVAALGATPRRVFLTLGRNDVRAFEAAPVHSYLVRSVDPIDPPLALPNSRQILARGPFDEEDEAGLMTAEAIDIVVSKNSGGEATYAKIVAARRLGIAVVMIDRPVLPEAPSAADVATLMAMIDHRLASAEKRGV